MWDPEKDQEMQNVLERMRMGQIASIQIFAACG